MALAIKNTAIGIIDFADALGSEIGPKPGRGSNNNENEMRLNHYRPLILVAALGTRHWLQSG